MMDLEQNDTAYLEAFRSGDRVKMAALDAEREAHCPRPAPPSPPARKASGWVDIGDGWEELAIEPALNSARIIRGIASSSALNSHDYALRAPGMTADLPVVLRCNHHLEGDGVGQVHLFRRNDYLIYFEAELDTHFAADYAWQKCLSGRFKAVSLAAARGSLNALAKVDGKTFYGSWKAGELSLAPAGANPDARCEVLTPSSCDWTEYVSQGRSL